MPDPIVREIDSPPMDLGAPLPTVMATDDTLTLAYYGPDRTLVRIIFHHAWVHCFGAPNDETLAGHSLAPFGLERYGTFEVDHSPWIDALRTTNGVHPHHRDAMFDRLRHFVWTFHDNTFECVAEGFAVA